MIGASLKRKEDRRLVTGAGRYVDDLRVPGMVHLALVLEEDAHLATQDEEDLLDLVRVRGVALAGRNEHHAEREVLGRDVAAIGLTRGAVADEAMLRAPISVNTRISECVPVGDSVSPTRDLAIEQLRQRLSHGDVLQVRNSIRANAQEISEPV